MNMETIKKYFTMLNLNKIFLYFPTLVLFTGMICYAQIKVYDDFETLGLNKIWNSDRMVRNAFKIQSKIVRKGKSEAYGDLPVPRRVRVGAPNIKEARFRNGVGPLFCFRMPFYVYRAFVLPVIYSWTGFVLPAPDSLLPGILGVHDLCELREKRQRHV